MVKRSSRAPARALDVGGLSARAKTTFLFAGSMWIAEIGSTSAPLDLCYVYVIKGQLSFFITGISGFNGYLFLADTIVCSNLMLLPYKDAHP